MTAVQFKENWIQDSANNWCHFALDEINKSPIASATKDFLSVGFAEWAAPFLSFGLKAYNGQFKNIAELYGDYSTNPNHVNYWEFGSDGAGNPICFDVSDNDKILLLDHENEFQIIEIMNENISELAICLTAYRNFVRTTLAKNGTDAYLNRNFDDEQLSLLEDKLKDIKSTFWKGELNRLREDK